MAVTRQADRVDAVRDLVRANGKRWTIAKGAVVEALVGADEHLSVQQVHETIAARFPQIDRSTVHRILLALAEEHVVHVLGRQGEARYGMADEPHHHAVCARCGRETEIPAKVIAPALSKATAATGFTFATTSITLTGLCETCTTS
ncbi:transcriptional repressor [Actinoplanes bogorensis]|uniref:Transcriptional repressor n=1 Tax=Paractinoplanes bogorensis TaxID=1610840 RepID=A0ABS5YWM4_9ACTN|nr:transcriptional repressor [Actinoplanes bogorensis]MBU2667114.1 transcriptional repressor [Actinoplanes bogorensis]